LILRCNIFSLTPTQLNVSSWMCRRSDSRNISILKRCWSLRLAIRSVQVNLCRGMFRLGWTPTFVAWEPSVSIEIAIHSFICLLHTWAPPALLVFLFNFNRRWGLRAGGNVNRISDPGVMCFVGGGPGVWARGLFGRRNVSYTPFKSKRVKAVPTDDFDWLLSEKFLAHWRHRVRTAMTGWSTSEVPIGSTRRGIFVRGFLRECWTDDSLNS
jgi:hypothetical protein